MNRSTLGLVLFAALGFCACSEAVSVPPTPTFVSFSTTEGTIPVPNDLLFKDSLDATLNLPDPEDVAQQGLIDAMNSLDGWSTTAPISFKVNHAIDPATLAAGPTGNVRLFEVTLDVNPDTGLRLGTPVIDVVAEVADFVLAAASDNLSVAILPTTPLKPKTSYMLVVTNGLQDAGGVGVVRGESYLIASMTDAEAPLPADHPLVALRPFVHAMETMASTDTDVSPAIAKADIAVTATFTTQSTFEVLAAAQLVALGSENLVIASLCPQLPFGCDSSTPMNTVPSATVNTTSVGTTNTLLGAGPGLADVYVGSLTLPYYLTAAANDGSGAGLVQDTAPLTERWQSRYTFFPGDPERNVTRYNPLALQTGSETVPMLITLPNGASGQTQPGAGWPVVIFQHGITGNRTNLLGIADAFASQGFAAVAIDLPLHGLVATGGLHVGVTAGGLRERTFGLDLVTQDSEGNVTAATPDGVADSSGAHFINLSSLQTQRDNLRQGVADLFAVQRMILDNLDVDGVSAPAALDFDENNVHFVGHSLGAVVGTAFTALDGLATSPMLVTSTLAVPSAGIPRMLEASVRFGPVVVGGLAAAGVVQGTPEFDSFMFAAQTVVDSGDPINFGAANAAGALTPVLMQEVVGGGPGGGLTDQVVPNNVATAPLSGTDPLAATMGILAAPVTTTTTTGAALVRFWEGTHSSLLDPDPDLDANPLNATANAEMQAQVMSWLLSGGTQITVGNNGANGVIELP